jgi:integrase
MTDQKAIEKATRAAELAEILGDVGEQANAAAARSAFADYRSRKADNTLRSQDAALEQFSEYLAEAAGQAPTGEALATTPEAWSGITWGLVEGFVRWLLLQGYAVGTVNVRLSAIRTYAKLAAKAGAIPAQELAMIRAVQGYSRKEAKRINERREEAGLEIRQGDKKRDPIVLTQEQAQAIKDQPDTPQGRRDAVLVRLMLDLGLRCGEVASLTVTDVDIKRGQLSFYREKVGKGQTHELVNGLQAAMSSYLTNDALAIGPLLRASHKGGELTHAGMSKRAITDRVRTLGEEIGIDGLSAHDLRHTWATLAARNGTPIDLLREAGGWSSLAMPARYIEAAKVANQGINLG